MINLGEIITTAAVAAFMFSLYMFEGRPGLSIIIMFFSAAWIIGYSWWQEEERIARAKERER